MSLIGRRTWERRRATHRGKSGEGFERFKMEFEWQSGKGDDGCSSLEISAMDMPEEGEETEAASAALVSALSSATNNNTNTLLMEENTHQTLSGGSSMDDDSDDGADPDHERERAEATTMGVVDPEPHLSTQFYTFNQESHHLMVQCLLQSRYAKPEEIRRATSPNVLASWRGVWKDRNEDTAYVTGWKRIQDKLSARLDEQGNDILFFKNNPGQCVPHIKQWQDIAMAFHADGDADFRQQRHLSVKDTIERIKQAWTVGAKFYGIPESFVRVCIASCPICRSEVAVAVAQPRSKRRRFEYTESLEIPARDVPQRLQQLAAKHKVVLCIRQKYIRYKPFMAEVKDYCCHRAGEPNSKKPGVLKRKRYSSKRCGCGFRIRAIVPIKDYNQKDKTFAYEDEGKAVFKLYAVHSGHEPGPHEGSARIIHRFVGPANSAIEQGNVHMNESEDGSEFAVVEREREMEEVDLRGAVAKQVEEFKMELCYLEGKIAGMDDHLLLPLSTELCAITQRLRNVPDVFDLDKTHSDDVFLTDPGGLVEWADDDNKDRDHELDLIASGDGEEEEEECNINFEVEQQRHQGPNSVSQSRQRRRPGRPPKRKVPRENSKLGKCPWTVAVKEPYNQFDDDKSLLVCEDSKTGISHDGAIVEDGLGLHVDGYYHDNIKWYEGMSCALDPSADCGDNLSHAAQEGIRHAVV